jgi:mono/diheme cytochrome c family protein
MMEGSHCFLAGSTCSVEGLELPIWELRNPSDTCALIGGHVYRGSTLAPILGAYVFGDYCSGRIWGLRYDEQRGSVDALALLVPSLRDPYQLNISGFGQDLAGNLYAFSVHEPTGIYRLVSDPVPADLLPFPRPPAASPVIPTQQTLSPAASSGRELFLAVPSNAGPQTLWCQQCHTIEGVPGADGRVGPELTHIGISAAGRKPGMSAQEYLRESLVDPETYVAPGVERATVGLMTPSITGGLTAEQIDAIVALLLTLKP